MKGTGSMFNSKYKSSASNTISPKYKELKFSRLQTPGPGAYQTFSEFGIYKSKYADQMDRRELRKSYSALNATKRRSKTPLSTNERDKEKNTVA